MAHFNIPAKKQTTREDKYKKIKETAAKYDAGWDGTLLVITKRSRRAAKKLFKKHKHSPWGYSRKPYVAPKLPPEIIQWYIELDMQSQKLFKRNYSNLSDSEKSKLHNSLKG